jgi:DNA processing protein
MPIRDKELYTLALSKLKGFGPVRARELIEYFGSAKRVFEEKPERELSSSSFNIKWLEIVRSQGVKAIEKSEQELLRNEAEGAKVTVLGDDDYPSSLSRCADAPMVLFYKGKLPSVGNRLISIVGTRKMSQYGREATADLVKMLANYNLSIVSGLAYGVDIQAHRESLRNNIPTIAVLGSGLGEIYPSAHRTVAVKLQETGCLISEFDYLAKPDRENFPRRNRIVAGISEATIVVEAGREGGAWITARLANEYGKEVFAIPGPWNSEVSKGCHDLISRHTAAILPSVDDFPKLMGWEEKGIEQQKLFPTDKKEIALALARHGAPMHMDDLTLALETSVKELQAILFELEMEGHIRLLPGRFVKLESEMVLDVS